MNMKKIIGVFFSVVIISGFLYFKISLEIKKTVEASKTFSQAVTLAKSDDNIYHLHNTFINKKEQIKNSKVEIGKDNELIYYNQLAEFEKEIYLLVDYSINNYDYLVIDFSNTEFGKVFNTSDKQSEIDASFLEFDKSVHRAELAYYYDNPEVYWAETSQYVEIIDNYYISEFNYFFSKKDIGYTEKELYVFLEDKKEFKNKLNNISTKIADKTSGMDNDWDKALYISKWICDNVKYDNSVLEEVDTNAKMVNGSIYSAVTNNTSVCRGYTELYKYLLDYVGINNQQCTGDTEESETDKESKTTQMPSLFGEEYDANHIWNVAELNGGFCNIDVTGMDSFEEDAVYNFALFGASDKELEKSHTRKGIFSSAKCENTKNSFFKHEKLYSNSLTKESIENAIEYAIDNDYNFASVQYKNPQDAENAYKKYVKNSLTLQNILYKYNRKYDKIITIDEKERYEWSIDTTSGVFHIFL